MDIYRLGIKFFAEPSSFPMHEFVPIFHTWIQKQIFKDHLLIDVHDYSHISQGPGVLLVAHEGNFSMDSGDDRLGLVYYRKQPTPGSEEERLVSVMKTALQACRLLEEEPTLQGRIRFPAGEVLVIANDRLNAPNDEESFSKLRPMLSSALKQVLGNSDFKLVRGSTDPKERLTVRVSPNTTNGNEPQRHKDTKR
jgi:hypothetical protein